jgi:hypothetical protein
MQIGVVKEMFTKPLYHEELLGLVLSTICNWYVNGIQGKSNDGLYRVLNVSWIENIFVLKKLSV